MFLHKHISANNTTIERFPFRRELSMEAYILENESVLSLEADGFGDVTIVESEVKLLNGRIDINHDGRVDIIAKYGSEYLAIVELKQGLLTENHLSQLQSYLKERDQIYKRFPSIWDKTISGENPKWIGIMVGESIDPDLMLKIRKGLYVTEAEIPIAALTINRYRGEDGNVYVVSDTYFVERVKGRDYTKYQFNHNRYPKNRLVLAVIKEYVLNHPNITYSELEKVFPQALQGRETFCTSAIAFAKRDRRNFIQPEELVKLKDSTIAVSNQWGLININRFIEYCRISNLAHITPMPN